MGCLAHQEGPLAVLAAGHDVPEPIIASDTSGDVRSVHHLLARLRRAGLIWPWPQRT